MNVLIKSEKTGVAVDALIRKKLKDKKLPECLGNMSPPLVSNVVEVEDTVFKVKGSIPEENIVLSRVHDIVVYRKYDTDIKYNRYILDINGEQLIENTKEEAASSYVDHLVACSTCKWVDLCNKLTGHYLQTIKLLEEK